MEQDLVLVEGGGYFTIINTTSIQFDPKNLELECGMVVNYLWPEGAVVQRNYKGTIIAISSKYYFTYLVFTLLQIII